MLKYLQPLPVSEEMLGAYLEGNLSMGEVSYMDALLQTDESLRELISEVGLTGDLLNEKPYLDQTGFKLDSMSEFQLPDLQMPVTLDEGTNMIDSHSLSCLCEDVMSFDVGDDIIDSTTDVTDIYPQDIDVVDYIGSGEGEQDFRNIDFNI